jgi:glycosyltransferase involved in cell wall biosynthesis
MSRPAGRLNFLWVIDFEHEKRLHHGALMRYFNFAPELLAMGHRVVFAVNFLDADPDPGIQYFHELKARGIFTDFVAANFDAPAWRLRAAARLIYPGLANSILRPVQQKFANQIDTLIHEYGSNVVLISGIRLLFLPQLSKSECSFIYDICDCQTLFERRQIETLRKSGDFVGMARALKPAMFAYAREFYYGRKPVMKIVVSPVDKEAIDRVTGNPNTSAVVLNGVRDGVPRGTYRKIPGRIIFTGNMDFEPNYEAALWFLDNVFPLVLKQRPDASMVIAGANPIPAILGRASKNVVVTGYVDDLNREIASSEIFVAPLISGGGFKNKIVEAVMNHTSVVATSMAVEFFPQEARKLVAVADSPAEMAEAIMTIWRDSQHAESRTETLHQFVKAEFDWARGAARIAELACDAIAQSANARSLR